MVKSNYYNRLHTTLRQVYVNSVWTLHINYKVYTISKANHGT